MADAGEGRKRKRSAPPKELPDDTSKRAKKYKRGEPLALKDVADKKVKTSLKRTEDRARLAAIEAAKAELLQTEQAGFLEAEGMEKTYKFRQEELAAHVDIASAQKVFDLDLPTFAPYAIRYSRNGRHLVMGGRKGHLASFDWQRTALQCELHVNQTVRDVTWLHNELLFAAAQRRFVYIYDHTGAEVQVLEKHVDVTRLEFLPYHFLLASVGNAGYLKYQDTSMNKLVVEHRTKLGPCHAMAQNRHNAVLHLGHNNGTVTLWTPNMTAPVVKALCHRGPVQALAIDAAGTYMTTSGLDGQLKVWDIRFFKDEPVFSYFTTTPAAAIDISQRGLTAVAYGPHVQVWKDMHLLKQPAPYMTHLIPGARIESARFAPFEDVLGLGHTLGFSSILVPGSGEPNYDAFEANPYQTTKQRQEAEVKQLLDKIPASLITLNPDDIVRLHRPAPVVKAADKVRAGDVELKNKQRGRSSSKRRFLRKQANVIDAKREEFKAKLEADKKKRELARSGPGWLTER